MAWLVRALWAFLALVPLLDIGSDIAMIANYARRGWFKFFAVLLALLILSLRFSVLYAMLHPRPDVRVIFGFLIPGFAEPTRRHIKEQARHDSRRLSNTASAVPSPPPSPPQPATHSIVLDIRTIDRPCCSCLDQIHDEMNYFFNRPGKRCVSLQTELLVLLAAPLIGPLVIMRACAVIAIDELGGRTARDANGRLPEPIAYARVVAFVEAVFESTPQLAAQTVAYYLSSDDNTTFDTALFVASATLSAGAILKGGATFFYYHSELVSILGAGAVAPLDVLLARGGGTRRSAELHFDNEKLSESDMRILASALGAGALPRLRYSYLLLGSNPGCKEYADRAVFQALTTRDGQQDALGRTTSAS